MFQWTVCKLTILLSYLIINTSQESRALIGSVVNYTPIWDQNKSNTDNILKNAENYCKLISDASKLSADIVVFPAEGLTGSTNSKISPIILPNIFDNPSDKNDSNQVLSLLSSCTKSRNIYSVFTIHEQLNNHNCLTQIALNRNGTIIARNREVRCRNNSKIEEEMFVTEEGQRIGLMLNGDLFLQQRTDKMKKLQIKYFVLSYDLRESLPFFTGIQTEWWWSYGQNEPLLAAGLGERGRSGSGLYIGRNVGLFRADRGNQQNKDILLVSTLPTVTDRYDTDYDSYSWSDSDMLRIDRMKELISDEVRFRRSSSTAYASAEAYVSVEKRDLAETYADDNMNGYKQLPIYMHFKSIYPKTRIFSTDETLCQYNLCCRFQLKWKVRKETMNNLNSSSEDINCKSIYGRDCKRSCYLLVVGDDIKEDIGGEGSGHVERCALVYSESRDLCRTRTMLQEQNNTYPTADSLIIYHQLLDRTNAKLQAIQITANQQYLTPNILFEHQLPNTNYIQYLDSPLSQLYIRTIPDKFITLGLQKIYNYKPY